MLDSNNTSEFLWILSRCKTFLTVFRLISSKLSRSNKVHWKIDQRQKLGFTFAIAIPGFPTLAFRHIIFTMRPKIIPKSHSHFHTLLISSFTLFTLNIKTLKITYEIQGAQKHWSIRFQNWFDPIVTPVHNIYDTE